MAKVYVKTLFQGLDDETVKDIAEHVFTRAERMTDRKEEVPEDIDEWYVIIRNVCDTMANFPRIRNTETIEIDLREEECYRRYSDGDPELYDIYETDWRKVANMEVVKIDDSSHDKFCKSMAILILALTEEGYTYEVAQKNQKEFWRWVDELGKKLVVKERKKLDHWPPIKPGRKKKGII